MTQDKIKRIHQIYSWVLSAVLVIIAVLVILSCLDIYHSSSHPYNAESIALRFHRIAIPIYIGIVGIVGGIILNLVLPLPRQRVKSIITPRENMLRMRQKASIPPVKAEIKHRLLLKIVTAIIYVALMIYPVIYYFTPGRFTLETAHSATAFSTIITLGATFIGLVLCFCCQLLLNASYRRETSIYKQAMAHGQQAEKKDICCCRVHRWIQISIAAIAIIFVIVGIFNGGATDVLTKAVAICTECIGLG